MPSTRCPPTRHPNSSSGARGGWPIGASMTAAPVTGTPSPRALTTPAGRATCSRTRCWTETPTPRRITGRSSGGDRRSGCARTARPRSPAPSCPTSPPGPAAAVTKDSVVAFALDTSTWRLATLFGLLDAVVAALDGGAPVVLGVESVDAAAQWIGLVSYLMSPGTAARAQLLHLRSRRPAGVGDAERRSTDRGTGRRPAREFRPGWS